MALTLDRTQRGFPTAAFTDRYGSECSIQESSLATDRCIWLGVDEPWADYERKRDVVLATVARQLTPEQRKATLDQLNTPRMHLTCDQVLDLLPMLTRFATTGELMSTDEDQATLLVRRVKELEQLLADLREHVSVEVGRAIGEADE